MHLSPTSKLGYLSFKLGIELSCNVVKSSLLYSGLLCFTSHGQLGHLETAPHLLSLAKDVKLGKYTVPTENRTPGRHVPVHNATAAPRKLHPYSIRNIDFYNFSINLILKKYKYINVLLNFYTGSTRYYVKQF